MNSNKFFLKAKESGISVSELTSTSVTNLSFSLFHKELDNYTMSSLTSIKARGVYNGKLGFVYSEDVTKNNIDFLIKGIKSTASLIENTEEPIIFKGSEKYHKKNVYNKDLPLILTKDKIKKLHELEDYAYSLDKRITDVECGYEETDNVKELSNSYGLKLKEKTNYYCYYLQIVAKDGDEVKNDFELYLNSDFSQFNYQELAKKAVNNCIAKFHGQTIKSKTYKAVLDSDVVASFIGVLINGHASAEEVQKDTSLFKGKLNQQLFSNKLTVEEKPLEKSMFFSYFDDEGVATYNKKIIDKGVLKTYLYNLETAKKDGVVSTGNGYQRGAKMLISSVNLTIKPGKLTKEQLFTRIKNGVYISSVTGLNAGLNSKSGDFSLEAEGFKIIDGKQAEPLTLFTVAGNLMSVFKDIVAVGNDYERKSSTVGASSIAIRGIKVSAS